MSVYTERKPIGNPSLMPANKRDLYECYACYVCAMMGDSHATWGTVGGTVFCMHNLHA